MSDAEHFSPLSDKDEINPQLESLQLLIPGDIVVIAHDISLDGKLSRQAPETKPWRAAHE